MIAAALSGDRRGRRASIPRAMGSGRSAAKEGERRPTWRGLLARLLRMMMMAWPDVYAGYASLAMNVLAKIMSAAAFA